MRSRKKISEVLKISEQYLSMLLNGKRAVSWLLAEKLADMFPGKSIKQWKNAKPTDLKGAFAQLKIKESA